MAPSAKILEGDLQKATRHLYETDEDNLTVNAVRKRAEEMRDLDEGFFAAPEWKAKSKTIITEFLVSAIYARGRYRLEHPADGLRS